ncbi:MAG: nucleotide exchange factor GrpE [Candidatus Yanofskybacteria bacterium]|nr:nucleotide exchange factor GrpE [Candidatus Yanofskybacteria bacterium]
MEHHENNIPEELPELEQKAQEYLDGWKRAQADLVNFKKDEAKRIEELLKFGQEKTLVGLLEQYDDLERALQHAPPNTDQEWLKGIQQVAKGFQEFLKKQGIEKIESDGSFDPNHHEAIHQDMESEHEGQKILEEYRPGYTLHGKVIRPARVKISK